MPKKRKIDFFPTDIPEEKFRKGSEEDDQQAIGKIIDWKNEDKVWKEYAVMRLRK